MLLSKYTRKIGAFLIIILLLIVFPANIYLYISEVPRELLGITKTQALIRMPFQIPLIILAYWHSQKNVSNWLDILSSIIFIPTVLYFITL
jgi:uncharacterized membrane protein